MPRTEVVGLVGAQDDLGLGGQQCVCANPRCDEVFFQASGPGRRKTFHSDDCRRAAERDLRRTQAQLAHYERQAEQLRARARAYLRMNFEDVPEVDGPSDEQRQAAREALAEVRGMARFLENHQDEFAVELLRLFKAVEPVVR